MNKKQQDAIQNAVTIMEKEFKGQLRDVFASYNYIMDDGRTGFGNVVAKFPVELYKDNLQGFINHLEKSITMALETMHKNKFQVKVLFFR